MRYGAVRDMLLGARVILPNGRRLRFGRPLVKNVAGYDMVSSSSARMARWADYESRCGCRRCRAPAPACWWVDDLSLGLALGRSLLRLSYVRQPCCSAGMLHTAGRVARPLPARF